MWFIWFSLVHASIEGPPCDLAAANTCLLNSGTLLRSVSLPVSLHSIAADPAEHALYLGGGDGRIFEVSLIGSIAEASETGIYTAGGSRSAQLPVQKLHLFTWLASMLNAN